VAASVVTGATAAVVLYTRTRDLPRLFLVALGGLLFGYACFGWRFASLGVGPLFVGEIVLATGLLAAFRVERPQWLLRSPLLLLLMLFVMVGALRTAPFLSEYGIDAARDAVVWVYALFAILVAANLRQSGLEAQAVAQYARWVPLFLLWAPAVLIIARLTPDASPSSVIYRIAKAGDVATHLAGGLTFLLLGLHRRPEASYPRRLPWAEWLLWGFILIAGVMVAATTRGGLLAILIPVGVVLLVRPGAAGIKVALAGGGLLFLALLTLAAEVSFGTSMGRELSAEQLVNNLGSIFTGRMGQSADGTRVWRLMWWNQIIEYTVHGEYFWTGKGFGINLANSDGFQVLAGGYLRSPHSIHMTVLARAGVPGMVLWAAILVVFAGSLVRGYLQGRRAGDERWACVHLWILVYWLALLINASFDVYLEGPQGGIWFWSLIGFGIAVRRLQRSGPATTGSSRTLALQPG
jgi:hypothetical protein